MPRKALDWGIGSGLRILMRPSPIFFAKSRAKPQRPPLVFSAPLREVSGV